MYRDCGPASSGTCPPPASPLQCCATTAPHAGEPLDGAGRWPSAGLYVEQRGRDGAHGGRLHGISTLAAYAFAQMECPGHDVLLNIFIAMSILVGQAAKKLTMPVEPVSV